jgi:hypothetical protein
VKKTVNVSSKFSEDSLRSIAREKVNYRISVKIHVIVFLFVNAVLLLINLITLPNFLWVIYPVISWQTGLILHTVAYILYARGVYPMAKRGLIYNIIAYLSSLILLFGINYLTIGVFNWAYYPAIFWGCVIILHIIIYIIYYRKPLTKEGIPISRKEIAIQRELEKMKAKMAKQNK